jgi:glycosyltransferase involved in cell wall biosynthesis
MNKTDPPSSDQPLVSIVMLTHNAVRFSLRAIRSLRRTLDVPFDVIVVDNRSAFPTRLLLFTLSALGAVDTICFLPNNRLFASGNNIGASLAARATSHILLINSDVEVRDPRWLTRMLAVHRRGATALGYVAGGPRPRADG